MEIGSCLHESMQAELVVESKLRSEHHLMSLHSSPTFAHHLFYAHRDDSEDAIHKRHRFGYAWVFFAEVDSEIPVVRHVR